MKDNVPDRFLHIVYATALENNCVVITRDALFKGLEMVVYVK